MLGFALRLGFRFWLWFVLGFGIRFGFGFKFSQVSVVFGFRLGLVWGVS